MGRCRETQGWHWAVATSWPKGTRVRSSHQNWEVRISTKDLREPLCWPHCLSQVPQGGNQRINSPEGRWAGSTLDLFDPDRLDQLPGPQSRRGEGSALWGVRHADGLCPAGSAQSPVVWETIFPAMSFSCSLGSWVATLLRVGEEQNSGQPGVSPSAWLLLGANGCPLGTSDDILSVLPGPEHSTGSLVLQNSPWQPETRSSLIRKTDHTHLQNAISLLHSSFLEKKKKKRGTERDLFIAWTFWLPESLFGSTWGVAWHKTGAKNLSGEPER